MQDFRKIKWVAIERVDSNSKIGPKIALLALLYSSKEWPPVIFVLRTFRRGTFLVKFQTYNFSKKTCFAFVAIFSGSNPTLTGLIILLVCEFEVIWSIVREILSIWTGTALFRDYIGKWANLEVPPTNQSIPELWYVWGWNFHKTCKIDKN